MWIGEDSNLPGRTRAQLDQDLREIKKSHRAAPHKGIAPEVTPDTILTFGIHVGKKVKYVPVKYLKYIAKQCREGRSLYSNDVFDQIRIYVEKTGL